MPVSGECSSTRWLGVPVTYGESETPSTEVASTPSLTIIAAIGVPAMIDWPTMACSQAAGRPSSPRPTRARWRKAER